MNGDAFFFLFPSQSAYLDPMKPNPEILAHVLESFSFVEINGIIPAAKMEIFPFSQRLAAARKYMSRDIAPDTLIVCFSTVDEDPDRLERSYFRRDDLFIGEVNNDGVLVAEGLGGGPRKLIFYKDGFAMPLV